MHRRFRLGSAADFLQLVVQPPPAKAVTGALTTLQRVGALTEDEALTALGAQPATTCIVVHQAFYHNCHRALFGAAASGRPCGQTAGGRELARVLGPRCLHRRMPVIQEPLCERAGKG